jgi:hypothetical protein
MTIETCLRCDWQGATSEPTCPSCGGRSVYLVRGSREAWKPEADPRVRSGDLASVPGTPPSGVQPPDADPSASPTDEVEPSTRSTPAPRSTTRALAVGVVTVVLAVILGGLLIRNEERPSAPAPSMGAAAYETPARERSRNIDTMSRVVGGVPLSFTASTPGWAPGPIDRSAAGGGFRAGSLFISKSIKGPQEAEAIILWASFPDDARVDTCTNLRGVPVGASAADLAWRVASAPGLLVVTGPSDVTVGGHPAKHVVANVREDLGCDPGYFFSWRGGCWGPCWVETNAGDTISVWITDVDGARLFIEAETTTQADRDLKAEVAQVIESISFDQRA